MKYYTVTETAKLFGVARQTIHNWILKGKIEYIEANTGARKAFLIPESAVEKRKEEWQGKWRD